MLHPLTVPSTFERATPVNHETYSKYPIDTILDNSALQTGAPYVESLCGVDASESQQEIWQVFVTPQDIVHSSEVWNFKREDEETTPDFDLKNCNWNI